MMPRLTRTVIHTAIEQALQAAWRNMMDGVGTEAMSHFAGMVHLAEDIGGITYMEARGWLDQVNHCPENTQADPGHNGGRAWCAYCGDIVRPEDNYIGIIEPARVGSWTLDLGGGQVISGTSGLLHAGGHAPPSDGYTELDALPRNLRKPLPPVDYIDR